MHSGRLLFLYDKNIDWAHKAFTKCFTFSHHETSSNCAQIWTPLPTKTCHKGKIATDQLSILRGFQDRYGPSPSFRDKLHPSKANQITLTTREANIIRCYQCSQQRHYSWQSPRKGNATIDVNNILPNNLKWAAKAFDWKVPPIGKERITDNWLDSGSKGSKTLRNEEIHKKNFRKLFTIATSLRT